MSLQFLLLLFFGSQQEMPINIVCHDKKNPSAGGTGHALTWRERVHIALGASKGEFCWSLPAADCGLLGFYTCWLPPPHQGWFVVGKAQGWGCYQNKGTARGSSWGGAHILVMLLSKGLTKCKATASADWFVQTKISECSSLKDKIPLV